MHAAVSDALRIRERCILAVSGGVDSMVMLHAAAAVVSHERMVVATFDHGTGDEATRAAELVAEQATALGIECVSERAGRTLTSEAELRAGRWEFLRRVGARLGGAVCTAHTADDQIETVLMRVMRDAGARGLAALFAESDIVRPLLAFTRADVLEYARRRRVRWVEDPTNASPAYLRNRVRHDLLPALRRAHSGIDAELMAVATRASRWRLDVDQHVSRVVAPRLRARGRGLDVDAAALAGVSADGLATLWPAIAARAGLALDRRGTVRLAEFTGRARVGARIQLSGGWEVIRSRDALQLRASSGTRPTPAALALSDVTSWYDWSFRPTRGDLIDNDWCAWLRPDCRHVIRSWEPGDAMGTRASGRARKVKELLSEAGVTGHQRAGWPVVIAEHDGEIVWVPGVRRSEAASDPAGQPGLSFVCEYINR
jgi:tRNA(Ile)-lysidine synthase